MDPDRNPGSIIIVILNCDLGFSIRSQPGASPVLANFGEAGPKFSRKDVAEGHQLGGFIGGIAKHDTLVTSTNLLRALGEVAMDTLCDIRALLLNVNKDLAVISVEANIIRNKSNLATGIAHDLLVVYLGFGRDLAKDHDHVGLGASLTGNFAVWVLFEAGIKDCV
ncbi:hypothetical protein Vadar_013906 [Vaccinium darrowii]|uniref:Uncharacterized protein n=1 Tax=Vaccinium darrowii TaxID=229202 RepID=A0ACB7ZJG7_9ERIC|nr:hypothetical protein Vadar_013906 [Vaccinium darrowii]